MIKKKKKRGSIVLILFFLALFTILIMGFIAAMLWGIVDYGSDTITPIMEDLGVIPGTSTNMSEYAGYTFTQANRVVQALPWIIGFGYVGALMFTIIFVISIRFNPHPVFIGFYFALIILLIFGSIVMSNMYQDMYSGDDVIATRLQEQTIMSYMILFSPFIMTLIATIAGIFLFARSPDTGGGFGV